MPKPQTHTITEENMTAVIDHLAATARIAQRNPKQAALLAGICAAVANLIAGSGEQGSAEQARLMRAAELTGFVAEFYAGSIRVSFPA
jgi:tellurite resistance protein